MKRLWGRLADWVGWRWKLPATYETVRKMYWAQVEKTAQAEIGRKRSEAFSATCVKRLRAIEKEAGADGPPGLTAAEIERLAILAEECGEVAQAVGKVLRHGWESQSPYGSRPNRVALEREIGNVRAVVNLMLDAGDVRLSELQAWQRRKRDGLEKWTHYQ